MIQSDREGQISRAFVALADTLVLNEQLQTALNSRVAIDQVPPFTGRVM